MSNAFNFANQEVYSYTGRYVTEPLKNLIPLDSPKNQFETI